MLNTDLINRFLQYVNDKTFSGTHPKVNFDAMMEGFTDSLPEISELRAWLGSFGCLEQAGNELVIDLDSLPKSI